MSKSREIWREKRTWARPKEMGISLTARNFGTIERMSGSSACYRKPFGMKPQWYAWDFAIMSLNPPLYSWAVSQAAVKLHHWIVAEGVSLIHGDKSWFHHRSVALPELNGDSNGEIINTWWPINIINHHQTGCFSTLGGASLKSKVVIIVHIWN